MGDNSDTIEVQIGEIEEDVEKLYVNVRRMVKQYNKIIRFLLSQEMLLSNK